MLLLVVGTRYFKLPQPILINRWYFDSYGAGRLWDLALAKSSQHWKNFEETCAVSMTTTLQGDNSEIASPIPLYLSLLVLSFCVQMLEVKVVLPIPLDFSASLT
ncbi:hypothetical protein VTO42DRAFT_7695 [Malbranchea cinnamomea]